MPMTLQIKQQQLGSFLKLRCLICIDGEENKVYSDILNFNDLAMVRFTFETKDSRSALITKVMAQKHTNAHASKIKVKVSCHETDEPFYSEWICKDEQYREIGHKLSCDISHDDVRTCLLNITISASAVQDCLLEKLYNDVDFTDFHLSSPNGSVAVHRAHLAAHSDVFKAMFKAMLSREWEQTTEGKVTIKGVTMQTLQHLKQYMYLGSLPDEGLLPLLLIASYYSIEDLKEQCVLKVAHTVKRGDWCNLFEFATENNIPELICAVTLVNPESVLEGIKLKKQVSELNE